MGANFALRGPPKGRWLKRANQGAGRGTMAKWDIGLGVLGLVITVVFFVNRVDCLG